MAQSAAEPATDPEILAYNYDHFDLARLDSADSPREGDSAPGFTATTPDGDTVSLADFRGSTVVLETGSATCPMYVQHIDAMNTLAGRFTDVVFLVLYTREAHPGDHIGPHRTVADKIRDARLVAGEDGERRTIAVDDVCGSVHQRYGAMPNSAHIVDATGTVVFAASWSSPRTIEEVLRRLGEGRSLDNLPTAALYPSPSPAVHDRVLNRAGPQAVRDFAAALPGLRAAHRHPDPAYPSFRHEDLYASPPPWDIGRPQPTFRTLANLGAIRGRVLDVGCGTGEHALLAAGLGLDATGVDLAGNALEIAEQKAHDRGLTARFVRHDARHLADLGETFDTVLDSGLFHIFDDTERPGYVASLRSILRPGGRYFMLGFSDRQPGEWGHRRVHKLTRNDIEAAFTDGWCLDSVEPATIDITTDPDGIRAWLVAATRTE